MENSRKNHWKHCMDPNYEKIQKRGKVWGGLIVVLIGAAFMAKALGVLLPTWLFTWPVLLILAGFHHLAKHGFQRPGALIPIAVGGVFLAEKIMPGLQFAHIAWPALIILFGLGLIMSPWKKWRNKREYRWDKSQFGGVDNSTGDTLVVDSVFGGVEKMVQSKNFKGGKINCVFGGAEINLLQADIEGTVVLEVSAVFGGVDLTVPASWKIQTEISAILGGVEDKRRMTEESSVTDKILILKGSVILGGVSIKGY